MVLRPVERIACIQTFFSKVVSFVLFCFFFCVFYWFCFFCYHLKFSLLYFLIFLRIQNDFNFNTEECGRRWGLFWHRIMRGWEFVECSKAYGSLITVGKDSIQRMLTNFFNNTPGKFQFLDKHWGVFFSFLVSCAGKWPEIERRLRIFFRWFVLDYCFKKNEDVGFWVATVLESLTTYHQAKLLYLIFGPLARGY